jgi:hypothetical protein
VIISLDTETTGVDHAHGAMPFLVTTCSDEPIPDPIRFWEWPVNPLTRQPEIPDGDIEQIVELIDTADLIYLHNAKFDARALLKIGVQLPWAKVRDTLIASHLLASNHRHDLTWCCIEYLGADIERHELLIKEVTQKCRAIVKRDFPDWLLADEGKPGMPSVKGSSKRDEDKPWKNDMWLPCALIKVGCKYTAQTGFVPQQWETACSRYANADSEHTLPLGLEMERLIRERGYWKVYEHRLRLPQVDCDMEEYGITARGDYTETTIQEYEQHVAESEAALVDIAAGYGHELELAAGAALNDNMRDFFYGAIEERCPLCNYTRRVKHWNGEYVKYGPCPKCLKRKKNPVGTTMSTNKYKNLALPVIISKKTGNASLDGDAMKDYLTTLDDGPALDFIEILADKRMYDTALSYMEAYHRYWVPVKGVPGYYRIHGSFNPCGTDHLRQSSNSPNMQNVSGESKEISNRACFGPLPNREWWRMDFKSIERRIPAYESGEPKMIEVFERPNEPPYWGSLYYLTASILYPDEFWPLAEDSGAFKKQQPRLYKQAKFCDLAKQYGCGRRKYDSLSRIRGSFDVVDSEFPLLAKLQAKYLRDAERLGWVETLPDRTVDPDRGYPILASRTEDGRVLSTTPFNYHTSGTACDVKNRAMVKCADQCAGWRDDGFNAHLSLEVHDELLFDFPRGRTMEENMPRALVLRGLMEEVGDNLIPRIPTPVSMEYHIGSWAEGIPV